MAAVWTGEPNLAACLLNGNPHRWNRLARNNVGDGRSSPWLTPQRPQTVNPDMYKAGSWDVKNTLVSFYTSHNCLCGNADIKRRRPRCIVWPRELCYKVGYHGTSWRSANTAVPTRLDVCRYLAVDFTYKHPTIFELWFKYTKTGTRLPEQAGNPMNVHHTPSIVTLIQRKQARKQLEMLKKKTETWIPKVSFPKCHLSWCFCWKLSKNSDKRHNNRGTKA